MKKILSFVLVLAMIASMMCVSVSAATEIPDAGIGAKDALADLVGSHQGKGQGTIADGVSGFAQKEHSANVSASLSATINNKYAVEIYYQVSNITIAGDATWDVNNLVYVNNLTYATDWVPVDAETEKPTKSLEGDIKVGEFTVVNFSDLGIDVTLSATASTSNTGIYCKIANTEAALATATEDAEVEDTENVFGAYKAGDDETSNSSEDVEYVVGLYSDDWARAFKQLKEYNQNNGTITIASITITVVPNNSYHAVDPTPAQGQ